jgi:hypothetical protein
MVNFLSCDDVEFGFRGTARKRTPPQARGRAHQTQEDLSRARKNSFRNELRFWFLHRFRIAEVLSVFNDFSASNDFFEILIFPGISCSTISDAVLVKEGGETI